MPKIILSVMVRRVQYDTIRGGRVGYIILESEIARKLDLVGIKCSVPMKEFVDNVVSF
jgi:hypothetical protein